MGKSLSLDIRERVVSLVETGHSCHEASRRLCISAASAVRIMQRRRRTGCVAQALQGRARQSKRDVVSDFLKGQIDAAPDITMLELATVLFKRHTIRATPAMLSRHLIHRLNCTYKKIPDRYGKKARTSTCRAIRVDAPASTKDASSAAQAELYRRNGCYHQEDDTLAWAVSAWGAVESRCPDRTLAHPDLHCRVARG